MVFLSSGEVDAHLKQLIPLTYPPTTYWLLHIVGFEGYGPQLAPGRIEGHKGRIRVLSPPPPILLLSLLYGFNTILG